MHMFVFSNGVVNQARVGHTGREAEIVFADAKVEKIKSTRLLWLLDTSPSISWWGIESRGLFNLSYSLPKDITWFCQSLMPVLKFWCFILRL